MNPTTGPLLRRRTLLGLAGATALAALTGCGTGSATGAGPTGTLRLGTNWPFVTFDAHAQARAGTAGASYWRPALDTLVRQGADGGLLPGLAESWEVAADRVVLAVRPGVTFHDGTPLDAAAVVANLERVRTDAQAADTFRTVTSITASDERTVELVLSAPAPLLLGRLTTNPGMMISPAVFGGPEVDTRPVGAGGWVYQPAESVVGQRYVFTRFPEFWDTAPVRAERLELLELTDPGARLNAALSGQVQLTAFDNAQAVQAGAAGLELVGRRAQRYVVAVADRAGTLVPALARPEARRALGWALDRPALVQGVLGGLGAPETTFVLEGQTGYDPAASEVYGYDPARARELLAAAGYPGGFSFEIPSIPPFQRVIEALVAQWREVGIEATIVPLDGSQYGPATAGGRYAAYLAPFFGVEPQEAVERFVGPTAAQNPFRVDDGELAGTLAELQATLDPAARDELSARLVRQTLEAGVLVPCFVGDQTAVVRAPVSGVRWTYVSDLAPDPLGITA